MPETMKLTFTRSIVLAIVLLICTILSVISILLFQSQKIQSLTAEIANSDYNRILTAQLIEAAIENESQSRGYVLTGQKSFLDLIKISERKMDELLILLTKNTTSSVLVRLLNDSITPAINKRKELTWRLAALKVQGKEQEARELIGSGAGILSTNEARRFLEKTDLIYNEILVAKKQHNQTLQQNLNKTLIISLSILLALSLINFLQIHRFFKRQQQTEKMLQDNEQVFSNLFYKSPSMNWIWSPTTTAMTDVNENFCRYLGMSKEEIIGKSSEELGLSISPEDTKKILDLLSSQGYVNNIEYKLQLKEKELSWVSASISMIPYKGEMCMMGALTDITSIKQNEELIASMNLALEQKVQEKTAQLRENEQKLQALNDSLERMVEQRTAQLSMANKELEAFSYSVSHDLRAPLRGIIGFTNIIQEDYGANMQEEEKRLFSIIKKNTLKMGNLIDDLLEFSRLGRKEISKTAIDMQAMVRDVLEETDMYNAKTDAVEWIIGKLPPVNADLPTIRQVWVNLIANAVKYSNKNPRPVIEIGSYQEEAQIVFFVKDNGVGFDEQYKNKLFQVFQRLHSESEFEGTGIGLAFVQKIIIRHEGKVWATGEVNKGAEFYFSLPQ